MSDLQRAAWNPLTPYGIPLRHITKRILNSDKSTPKYAKPKIKAPILVTSAGLRTRSKHTQLRKEREQGETSTEASFDGLINGKKGGGGRKREGISPRRRTRNPSGEEENALVLSLRKLLDRENGVGGDMSVTVGDVLQGERDPIDSVLRLKRGGYL